MGEFISIFAVRFGLAISYWIFVNGYWSKWAGKHLFYVSSVRPQNSITDNYLIISNYHLPRPRSSTDRIEVS